MHADVQAHVSTCSIIVYNTSHVIERELTVYRTSACDAVKQWHMTKTKLHKTMPDHLLGALS